MSSIEEILLNSDGVKVTPARIMINATTYAVANVASVRATKDVSARNFGILLVVIALLLGVTKIFAFGAIVGLLGALFIRFGTICVLIITTGAAEQPALRSRDQARILAVASAINLAIMKRSERR